MELIADAPAVASGTQSDPGGTAALDAGNLPAVGNQFAQLSPIFFARVNADPLPDPYLIAVSEPAARDLGIDPAALANPSWLAVLGGAQPLPCSIPLAAVYSGHQFGVWAGQLGDGRAILLGDIAGSSTRLELQLKGAGVTPYSRMGDGRAVLRSSIREFLCSEAMASLGIPTTRALAVVGSDLPVFRETVETAAIVARVAESFVRFGSFEHWYAAKDTERLRELADYVIANSYPEFSEAVSPYAALLREVTVRSARLVAQWQAVGFCHGVLNTDNMSILGQTLDYGPFGFLEAFDWGWICNHSDHQGRYAYGAQPGVVHWNLYCLGQALLPLIGSVDDTKAALAEFEGAYDGAMSRKLCEKLGFATASTDDDVLIDSLYNLLQANHPDYTTFFRQLSNIHKDNARADAVITDLLPDRDAGSVWLELYRKSLSRDPRSDEERKLAMDAVNPKYVLRNYLAEVAIRAAQQHDFSEITRLAAVLARPFDEQPESSSYAALPPDWANGLEVSCSS
jgi:serine/tyrosine/threonine adenylyltransferase